MLSSIELDDLAAFAERLADAGGQAALPYFRRASLATEDKGPGDAFDPVTLADREAEAAMRRLIAAERPGDGVVGEEEASTPSTNGLTWVLDPIDGTRSFISGVPVWGVLVALDDGSTGRIGVVDQPYTGERFVGIKGGGGSAAILMRGSDRHEISTRACAGLDQATLFTTSPEIFSPSELARFGDVSAAAKLTRYGIDCYAYALLAMGQIDLVIEAGLERYDIAAPAALIEAAGGVVTDWEGGDGRHGGQVIAAGDARTHAEALEMLSRQR